MKHYLPVLLPHILLVSSNIYHSPYKEEERFISPQLALNSLSSQSTELNNNGAVVVNLFAELAARA